MPADGSVTGDGETATPGESPFYREMNETHAVLWTVVVVATVADVVMTLTGLSSGFQEGNPVVRTMVGAFGVAGLWVVKFLAMCWLVAGWTLLSDWKATVFLGIFAVVTLAVVLNNAVVLLGV
jgi:hypothetical protein